MTKLGYEKRIAALKDKNPFISNTDLVYRVLLEDILECRRLPGSAVSQGLMAEELGVSRSPVRGAFEKLEERKYLKSFPNRGYYVYIMEPRDALRCVEFRTGLEVLAGSLAINRADSNDLTLLKGNVEKTKNELNLDHQTMLDNDAEFHRLLVASSKNDMLIETYAHYESKFAQLRNFIVSPEDHRNLCLRHTRIYNALTSRMADELERTIRDHLKNLLDDGISLEKYTYQK